MRKINTDSLFSDILDWIIMAILSIGATLLCFLVTYMIFSFFSDKTTVDNQNDAIRYCYDHNYPRIERVQDDYYCLPEQGQPGEIIKVPSE